MIIVLEIVLPIMLLLTKRLLWRADSTPKQSPTKVKGSRKGPFLVIELSQSDSILKRYISYCSCRQGITT